MCVCVCDRDRERERERESVCVHSKKFIERKIRVDAAHCTAPKPGACTIKLFTTVIIDISLILLYSKVRLLALPVNKKLAWK